MEQNNDNTPDQDHDFEESLSQAISEVVPEEEPEPSSDVPVETDEDTPIPSDTDDYDELVSVLKASGLGGSALLAYLREQAAGVQPVQEKPQTEPDEEASWRAWLTRSGIDPDYAEDQVLVLARRVYDMERSQETLFKSKEEEETARILSSVESEYRSVVERYPFLNDDEIKRDIMSRYSYEHHGQNRSLTEVAEATAKRIESIKSAAVADYIKQKENKPPPRPVTAGGGGGGVPTKNLHEMSQEAGIESMASWLRTVLKN